VSYNLTRGEKAFMCVNYFLLTLVCVVMLYPYLNAIAISFSDKNAVTLGKVSIWPIGFNTASYQYILKNPRFLGGVRVTLFTTIVGTFYSVFMTSLFAYPLSRNDFKLKTPLTLMVVVTMFFGGGLIPSYLLRRFLGLFDTIWVYIIPGGINTWSLIILRNFFQQLPVELEESAYIDGASDFTILIKIFVPISLPSIATITLWYLVGYWNVFAPSIYYTLKPELRTMQVVLRSVLMGSESIASSNVMLDSESIMRRMTSRSMEAAWIMATTVPILCVYPFLQKYFVKGVIVGSLKG